MTDTYELPELPELPEPDGSASVVVGKVPVGPMMGDVTEEIPAWSRKLVEDYARLAVKAEREQAAKVADSLNRPDELRLRMGEMKAQEMRSVQAVLRLVAAAIRKG